MRRIYERIARHARKQPEQVALQDNRTSITYQQLPEAVTDFAALLQGSRVGLLMNNSCAWAIADLAIMQRGATAIPVPTFFSDSQVSHLISDAEPDLIITDQPARLETLLHLSPAIQVDVAGRRVALFQLPLVPTRELPKQTAKITYTSGTTGQPRGVCLSGKAIAEVSIALSEAVEGSADDRTLSVLPLSTLLENIGGIYAPLYSGGTATLPDLSSCGFNGSSDVSPKKLLAAFHRYLPSSTILVPQLLTLLMECVRQGAPLPKSLRFIAVGGAPCSRSVMERARSLGLPVYEGYGLSEAASVVSLNLPGRERAGSIGKPLPHVNVHLANDGEIVVSGELFLCYLGGKTLAGNTWQTGDLGRLDEEGFLYITGRKKTAFATAYGRKVSPEWVETELTADRTLLQAAVFGDGRPFNVALLVPHPASTSTQIQAAIAAANSRLPDYARIRAWRLADSPFSEQNDLAHASGGLNRVAIAQRYATTIEHLYTGEPQHVAL